MNYDARSTTHQIYTAVLGLLENRTWSVTFTNRHNLNLTESNANTVYFQILITIKYTTTQVHYITNFLNIWLDSAHYMKQATFYAHAILTCRSTLVFR